MGQTMVSHIDHIFAIELTRDTRSITSNDELARHETWTVVGHELTPDLCVQAKKECPLLQTSGEVGQYPVKRLEGSTHLLGNHPQRQVRCAVGEDRSIPRDAEQFAWGLIPTEPFS